MGTDFECCGANHPDHGGDCANEYTEGHSNKVLGACGIQPTALNVTGEDSREDWLHAEACPNWQCASNGHGHCILAEKGWVIPQEPSDYGGLSYTHGELNGCKSHVPANYITYAAHSDIRGEGIPIYSGSTGLHSEFAL